MNERMPPRREQASTAGTNNKDKKKWKLLMLLNFYLFPPIPKTALFLEASLFP
jgi:hypothetical protein